MLISDTYGLRFCEAFGVCLTSDTFSVPGSRFNNYLDGELHRQCSRCTGPSLRSLYWDSDTDQTNTVPHRCRAPDATCGFRIRLPHLSDQASSTIGRATVFATVR